MLTTNNSVLVLVDVQGKLAQIMFERDRLFASLQTLVKGAQALGVPIVWVEQNPNKMGETIPELKALLEPAEPIRKMSFSCCAAAGFAEELARLNRRQVLLAGIEAHICVYQTAAALTANGHHVEVVSECVSSRTGENRQIGLDKCRAKGAEITSVETVLFELVQTAEHPAFRKILRLVK